MIIYNRVTSSLKLVETVDLRGPLHLFMRSFSASTGFSLEVFRDERHLASITPNNTGRGDLRTLSLANQALLVNLGPRIMTMTGQLYTRDNFTREYEVELRIHVSQPTQFAALYVQHSDPVAQAQRSIESIFTNYAQGKLNNEIDSGILVQLARNTLSAATQQHSGIAVDEVLRVDLRLDVDHRQVVDISREEMIEKARLRKEGNLASTQLGIEMPLQHKRDEHESERERHLAEHKLQIDALQRQHELALDELSRQHARKQTLQDVYAQGLSQMISDHLSKGYSLQELWQQYPELRGVLESSMPSQLGSPGYVQGLLPQPGAMPASPTPDSQRALPPASGNQAGENTGFRAKERRRPTEDGSNEVIEMESHRTAGFDAVYEPVIKVKQHRAAPSAFTSNASVTPTSPIVLPNVPAASQQPDPNAPTVETAALPATNSSQLSAGFSSSTAVPPSQATMTSFHNARLGVTLTTVLAEERRALLLDDQIVFSVLSVDTGSPAQRASMLRNDYLVEINKQPMSDIQTLLSRIDACDNGSTLSIRVLRMGQLINLPEVPMSL